MAKTNLHIILFCLLLFACGKAKQASNPSYIHSIIDTLDLDKTKNILIYTINPNDCISCIYGFKAMNKDVAENGNGKLYVISVDRLIEQKALSEKITDVDFFAEKNKTVIWDKKIFEGINLSVGKNLPASMVFVYDPVNDSLLYSKIIREVNDYNLLRSLLLANDKRRN